jgi:sec-independent protein translocase protein TatA
MLSLSHIALTLAVILIVFGAGKLPKVLGDLGKGIKNFKDSVGEGDAAGSEAAGSGAEGQAKLSKDKDKETHS